MEIATAVDVVLPRSLEDVWTASATCTRIQWSYTFTLTTPLAWPIARLAVFFCSRAMAGNLAGIRRLLGV